MALLIFTIIMLVIGYICYGIAFWTGIKALKGMEERGRVGFKMLLLAVAGFVSTRVPTIFQ